MPSYKVLLLPSGSRICCNEEAALDLVPGETARRASLTCRTARRSQGRAMVGRGARDACRRARSAA